MEIMMQGGMGFMKKYYNISFIISSLICVLWCIVGVVYIERIDVGIYDFNRKGTQIMYFVTFVSTALFSSLNIMFIGLSKRTIKINKKTSNAVNVLAGISLLSGNSNAIHAFDTEGKTINKKPLMTLMISQAIILIILLDIVFEDRNYPMKQLIPFNSSLLLIGIPMIIIIFNIITTFAYNYKKPVPKVIHKETDLGTPLKNYDFTTSVRITPWKEHALERILSYVGFVVLEVLFFILAMKTLSHMLISLFCFLLMFAVFCGLVYIHHMLYERTVGYEKQFQVSIEFYKDRFRIIYPYMYREELYGPRREVREIDYKLIKSATYNKEAQRLSIVGRITTTLFRLKKTRKDPFVLNKCESDIEVFLNLGLLEDLDRFLRVFEFLSKVKVINLPK